MVQIKLSDIYTDDDFNCRGEFVAMDVVELAKSIEAQGLLQPITVCRTESVDRFKNKTNKPFSLIMGFRRLKAHYVLNKETIECQISETISSEIDARLANLVENISRSDLTISQEARALKGLYDLKFSRKDIARYIGKCEGWVQLRMMLLSLPVEFQKEFEANGLNTQDLKALNTAYGHGGEPMLKEVFLKIKMAKQSGHSRAKGIAKIINKNVKRIRNKTEINALTELLVDSYEPSHTTRFLAWAAGEIDDNELEEELREYAKELDKPYRSLLEKL